MFNKNRKGSTKDNAWSGFYATDKYEENMMKWINQYIRLDKKEKDEVNIFSSFKLDK